MDQRKHRILIVEDDDDIRETVTLLLEAEGYEVHQAENGRKGLDLLRTIPRPCVILLDLMMPVLDGHEFMQQLRANDVLVTIPVVVASAAHSGPAEAAAFLRKPFDLQALIRAVEQYCAKPSGATP